MPDDKLIWEKIRKGNKSALKQLHDTYFHQLCLYAWKTVRDHQVVEELVSDCFIKLWENRKKIIISQSVKHYLYQMLKNGIIDHYRKQKYFTESIDNIPEPVGEADFDEMQPYAILYSTLEKLPGQRRTILELAVYDRLTYTEIAEKLEISVNTVKTQIGRAYRYLREHLDPADFTFFLLIK